MNELKPPTSFQEQINILKQRGLIISDEEQALEVLSGFNYYTLSGYLHDFRKPGSDEYIDGLTFEKIFYIIEFDRRFRNLLLYALEVIEHRLKTKIAFNHAHAYGPDGYLNASNFRSRKSHEIFVKLFSDNVKQNSKLPFVKHHKAKYGGVLPMWVAVELFTVGMLYHFYKNLPGIDQKRIAKEYNTGPDQLASWIDCVTYLRNMIAHYMRTYNFKTQKAPKRCKKNHEYIRSTHFVFDIIYTMKFMFGDKGIWDNVVVAGIKNLFEEYKQHIDPKCIGFNDKWEKYLSFSLVVDQVAVTKE